MTSRSIRRVTADDVQVITQIRNDAHANKVAHGDYAWGKDGDGFSERWVLNSLSRREVYVVEHDCMPVGTFSLDWDDETYWGASRTNRRLCAWTVRAKGLQRPWTRQLHDRSVRPPGQHSEPAFCPAWMRREKHPRATIGQVAGHRSKATRLESDVQHVHSIRELGRSTLLR